MRKFGLEMHVGRGETASKTEAMFCPKPRKPYEAENTEWLNLDGNGFIHLTKEFEYFGSLINNLLTQSRQTLMSDQGCLCHIWGHE